MRETDPSENDVAPRREPGRELAPRRPTMNPRRPPRPQRPPQQLAEPSVLSLSVIRRRSTEFKGTRGRIRVDYRNCYNSPSPDSAGWPGWISNVDTEDDDRYASSGSPLTMRPIMVIKHGDKYEINTWASVTSARNGVPTALLTARDAHMHALLRTRDRVWTVYVCVPAQ